MSFAKALKAFMSEDTTGDGVLLLTLATLLFSLEPALTYPETEENGYRIAVLLTTIAAVPACLHLMKLLQQEGFRRRMIYVAIAELTFFCWIALWIARSSPMDLRMLVILAGIHGSLWGLRLLHLAARFRGRPIWTATLCLLAAANSSVGVAIAVEPGLTMIDALNLVACYTVYLGVIFVSLGLCFYRFFHSQQTEM